MAEEKNPTWSHKISELKKSLPKHARSELAKLLDGSNAQFPYHEPLKLTLEAQLFDPEVTRVCGVSGETEELLHELRANHTLLVLSSLIEAGILDNFFLFGEVNLGWLCIHPAYGRDKNIKLSTAGGSKDTMTVGMEKLQRRLLSYDRSLFVSTYRIWSVLMRSKVQTEIALDLAHTLAISAFAHGFYHDCVSICDLASAASSSGDSCALARLLITKSMAMGCYEERRVVRQSFTDCQKSIEACLKGPFATSGARSRTYREAALLKTSLDREKLRYLIRPLWRILDTPKKMEGLDPKLGQTISEEYERLVRARTDKSPIDWDTLARASAFLSCIYPLQQEKWLYEAKKNILSARKKRLEVLRNHDSEASQASPFVADTIEATYILILCLDRNKEKAIRHYKHYSSIRIEDRVHTRSVAAALGQSVEKLNSSFK